MRPRKRRPNYWGLILTVLAVALSVTLLVKPVKAAIAYMPDAGYELPYEGAKEMLLVDNVDDSAYLCGLIEAMAPELPEKKKKR
jgi:hypothetical protein